MENDVLFWHWWVFAGVFLVIEMLAPGVFILWLGIAAGLVGLVLLVAPSLSLPVQLLLFAAVAIISVVGWKSYLKRHPTVTDEPTLNRRGQQYVMRVFKLTEGVADGLGKAAVDDTVWTVAAKENMPTGTSVRCIGVDGTVLRVERAEQA